MKFPSPSAKTISIAGIASAALKLIRRLMPGAEFDAEILPANTASIGLFRRAGFVAMPATVIEASLPTSECRHDLCGAW